jgi:arginyl-tRNA synthetase
MALDRLTILVQRCFAAAGFDPAAVAVEPSNRPDLSQFQCNAALTLAKATRQPPRAVANAVLPHLTALPELRDVRVDGPGFINFSMAEDYLTAEVEKLRTDPRLGSPTEAKPQSIIMDYGGPNVAKAMHVGHIRAGIIGDALHRMGTFLGHKVIGDVHLGDWGLPMGMLIAEMKQRWPDLPWFDPEFRGDYPQKPPVDVDALNELYPQAAARCAADEAALKEARLATARLQRGDPAYRALWQSFVDVSVAAIREEFELLDIAFDLWNGESDVEDRMQPLIADLERRGVAERHEGALIIPVARESDNKPMPPLILEKGDGGVTYASTDLATIAARVQDVDPDLLLYVVDQRQHLHFEQVFRAAEKAGFIRDGRPRCEHIGFGTINGPDGKPFKTRAGGVMRLKDLVSLAIDAARERLVELGLAQDMAPAEREEIANLIGIATIRFADLSNHRQSDYIFNLDKFSRFEGKTGPYMCYAAVRAGSILAKAAEQDLCEGSLVAPISDQMRAVYLSLLDFGRVVAVTFEKRAPNMLCDHVYELAQKFNAFYHQHHILSESDAALQGALLSLTRIVRDQLQLALVLLGIKVPTRM